MLRRASLLLLLLVGSVRSSAAQQPGWLGIAFRSQAAPVGALAIDDVFPGGPADRSGILPGDSLLQLNGRPVTSRLIDSALANLIS